MEEKRKNKKNISVRVNSTDLEKLKGIAKRLNVRDSDIYRFALKVTLVKLIPLNDEKAMGVDLIPAFIEFGTELTNYFDLDAGKLEKIFNDGVSMDKKMVDKKDIELLAMASIKEDYIYLRLSKLASEQDTPLGPLSLLRQHLYNKYVKQGYDLTEEELESSKFVDEKVMAQ